MKRPSDFANVPLPRLQGQAKRSRSVSDGSLWPPQPSPHLIGCSPTRGKLDQRLIFLGSPRLFADHALALNDQANALHACGCCQRTLPRA